MTPTGAHLRKAPLARRVSDYLNSTQASMMLDYWCTWPGAVRGESLESPFCRHWRSVA